MSRKLQNQFTAAAPGFIKKLQLCGNALLIERAIMHFGYCARNRRGLRVEAECLLTWARVQPWLAVEPANTCREGRDCETWRIRLLTDKLPTAQSREVA